MVQDSKLKDELYEFSRIIFRHLKWLSQSLYSEEIEYDYFRSELTIGFENYHESYKALIEQIRSLQKSYEESALYTRMISDENFIISALERKLQEPNHSVSAFDRSLKLEGNELDKSSTDALIRFLFEESYKEYELILVYLYRQTHTQNPALQDIFQDLIDESHFHLKSFGNMMAQMGILTLPRMIIESIYKVEDVVKFLIDGIAEEEAAKVECQELAASVKDEELSQFFTFIDAQESYHIELLKEAVENL
jgi:rubrerythrin